MSKRFQRVLVVIFSLIFLLASALLILFNVKSNIVFFLTPSELQIEKHNNTIVRVGGMVKENSYSTYNNIKKFIITDNEKEIFVNYEGILPDLFKEKSGVVVEGKLINDNLNASKVFAKHDENYMPATISDKLKEKGFWNKNY
ncbi:MAG: Cytochrome c-type biogenesis protein CcmE [Alphaproteobacteria bacterium MarineAlpha5_Bin12]|nr:cytochrome c maturation protein CcmE [Pelagibacteraceae bacterium]PPR40773.1 MAG: Cytochrome c-type biogenesis protein CcmE [Alphaproteobacteria bacterium MarineAlpha5_Bin12]|tara:strand:+ start:4930 stop:5358 length:429 start_codon:yes stop_codon:yes gene_type:complete